MRIVGGEFGGRKLIGPASSATRATTDKVREAIFNSLQAIVDIEDALVVDLFAGTGAWGIEALSRGAAHCTFVEKSPKAAQVVRRNIHDVGVESRSTVVIADALRFLDGLAGNQAGNQAANWHTEQVSNRIPAVVFADPPYEFRDWARIFATTLAEVLICETDKPDIETGEPGIGNEWRLVKQKKYGTTWVTYFVRDFNSEDGGVEPND